MMAKLNDLKSIDNKKTFLYYLVEYMADNNKEELLDVTSVLEKLENSTNFYLFLN